MNNISHAEHSSAGTPVRVAIVGATGLAQAGLTRAQEEHRQSLAEARGERDQLERGLASARAATRKLEEEMTAARDAIGERDRALAEHAAAIKTRDEHLAEASVQLDELERENASYQEQVLKAYQKIKADEALVARAKKALAIALTSLDDKP